MVISWRDLLEEDEDRERESAPPPRPRALSLGDVLPSGDGGVDPAAIAPNLSGLLAEQDDLRRNMAVLSGEEAELTDRDAARFALEPRQASVADYQQWLERHDRSRERSRAPSRSRQRPTTSTGGPSNGPTFRGRELQPAGTPPRSSLDQARPGSGDRAADPLRGGTRQADAGASRRNARSGVVDDTLRSFGRQRTRGSDEPPLRDALRDGLRDRLRSPDTWRGTELRRNKVVDDWAKRRDQARERTEEIGSYQERSKQILSLLEGGSGSLEDRAERALQKLSEKKIAEAKDEARRQRALESRQAREDER